MLNLEGKPVPSNSTHIFGMVSVGNGQGTIMGWNVFKEKETAKALLLKCSQTKKLRWVPKSVIRPRNADGHREITDFGVQLIRAAGFRATACYGDIV